MNRDIKFRCFDFLLKQMFIPSMINQYGDVRHIGTSLTHNQWRNKGDKFDTWLLKVRDSFALMQWTGLKDKNKKEIYEGDILKMYSHSDITHQHEVNMIWNGKERVEDIREVMFQLGTFFTKGEYGIEQAFMHMARPGDSYEVIGNIYENKELLSKYKT